MMELKTIYAVKRVDYKRNEDETAEMITNKLYSVHIKRGDAIKQMRHHARCEDNYKTNRVIISEGHISFKNNDGNTVKEYMVMEDQIRI